MTAIDKILERLEAVKKIGDRKFIAKCPAHDDRSPSLSIRETVDGRVLIHDFGGCGAVDVVEALGLTLADLFEKPEKQYLPPVRAGFTARELLELSSHEALVAAELADTANRAAAYTGRSGAFSSRGIAALESLDPFKCPLKHCRRASTK